MNIRLAAYLGFVGILFTGCTDNSYVGWVEDWYEFSSQIAVQVALGNPDAGIFSKSGTGEMESLNDFADKNIRVFAFNSDPQTDYSSRGDYLSCLIFGREAWLDGQISYARWKNDKGDNDVIYYPNGAHGYTSYDFFACYLDDLQPVTENAGAHRVSYEVDIDGSRDLMTSIARHPESAVPADSTATPRQDYCFSYYTAQRGIIPIFRMRHNLVRIDFEVKSGYTPEGTHCVRIDSLKLSSFTRGTMTVAAKDSSQLGIVFDETRSRSLLPLRNRKGDRFKPDSLYTLEMGAPAQGRLLDGCMFIAPDTSCDLHLYLSEAAVENGAAQHTMRVITYPGGFLPGNRYKVSLEIFGATRIGVGVELIPWTDGGGFVWDPDPRFRHTT